MYCWYSITVKGEMLEWLKLLSPRADACSWAPNFRHLSHKSTTEESNVGNAGGYAYKGPISTQNRMGGLRIELLFCVRRCAYVATVNVGAISHPRRNSPKYKRKRNNKRRKYGRIHRIPHRKSMPKKLPLPERTSILRPRNSTGGINNPQRRELGNGVVANATFESQFGRAIGTCVNSFRENPSARIDYMCDPDYRPGDVPWDKLELRAFLGGGGPRRATALTISPKSLRDIHSLLGKRRFRPRKSQPRYFKNRLRTWIGQMRRLGNVRGLRGPAEIGSGNFTRFITGQMMRR